MIVISLCALSHVIVKVSRWGGAWAQMRLLSLRYLSFVATVAGSPPHFVGTISMCRQKHNYSDVKPELLLI